MSTTRISIGKGFFIWVLLINRLCFVWIYGRTSSIPHNRSLISFIYVISLIWLPQLIVSIWVFIRVLSKRGCFGWFIFWLKLFFARVKIIRFLISSFLFSISSAIQLIIVKLLFWSMIQRIFISRPSRCALIKIWSSILRWFMLIIL